MDTRPAATRSDRWTRQIRQLLERVTRRKSLTAMVAGILAIVLVSGILAWQPARHLGAATLPSPSAASDEPSAGATTAPMGSPVPDLRTPVARLEASDESGGVVPLDASFRLTSLDGTAAAALAAGLVVEPQVDLDVVATSDPASVRLVPHTPLVPGTVYRFDLGGAAGQRLDSWAFQARQGVRVVGTTPGDEQTDIPLDSGIEITFDQDGVVDAEKHVTISPPVAGRFETHGRVLAFVPKALAPATAYTVSVSAGVTVAATGEASTQATTFRFETAGGPSSNGQLTFQDSLVESSTKDRPAIGLWDFPENDAWVTPKKARVEAYRLPSIDAAITGFQLIRAWGWTRTARAGLVPTGDLTRVVRADVSLQQADGALWLALPAPLPAGWYVVQIESGGRPIQTILQVTDLSAYLAVSDTTTVVWANDLASGRPVVGATVESEKTRLGVTGTEGLLTARTPDALLGQGRDACRDRCVRIVTVSTTDGRAAILATSASTRSGYDDGYGFDVASSRFWSVFNTDRTRFRPTDTINAWGLLRDRDTGDVPATVTVRLVAADDEPAVGLAAASIDLKPGPTGVFAGSIPLSSMPLGAYSVELVAGDEVVESRGIQVGQILKPAYRLELTTGHRVYIAGDRIKVSARASFFDGTPVPQLPLRFTDYVEQDATTDADGRVEVRTVARVRADNDGQPDFCIVYASPRGAEEGEIEAGSRDFIVFPSSRTVDAAATIADGRVRVTGGVHLVDQERLNAEVGVDGSTWGLDPRGKPVDGARISIRFVEQVPIRGEAHQVYDFLQKKVVTTYEYSTAERDAGTVTVQSNAKGAFSASIPADPDGHDYEIRLSTTDADGRAARATAYAATRNWADDGVGTSSLGPTDETRDYSQPYGIGESVDLTFVEPAAHTPVRSFLFLESQRGIRSTVVQSSPRFVTKFTAASAPDTTVFGVRFNGLGYDIAPRYHASFRTSDRALNVRFVTDGSRHAPGDKVTVDALVTDASDRPVEATVVVRVIDEKLFAAGAAFEVDALNELYRDVGSGLRATYATHRPPRGDNGYGDTGGGGDDRDDFRDALLFTTLDTGRDGRASVSFTLSDDLTSWRVIGAAVSRDLQAGSASVQVPVGLPFFVDASIAPEYLAADRPSIVVRAFGDALHPGDRVSVTVDSDSLGVHTGRLAATAFSPLAVALPRLTTGRHELTIRATSGSGSAALSDGIKRTFTVVDSRLSRTTSRYEEVDGSSHPAGGPGLTTVVVSDGGVGRSVPLLVDLASADGARLDSSLAAATAASLLTDRLGVPADRVPAVDFAPERYQAQNGGITLLPYASSDLELSAMTALVAPDRFDEARLAAYLGGVSADPDETRERRIVALCGRAALGEPVLPELRAAAANPDLTIRERLFVGIGAARIGDAATARAIADDLIRVYGEPSAGQIRLRVGASSADSAVATALAALLTASVGDRRAPQLWASAQADPPAESPLALQAVAYVEATLDWLDSRPARFAMTVGGKRTVLDLEAGGASTFTMTASQLADLTIERLDGAIAVTTSWREPVAAVSLEPDPDVSVQRRVSPSGPIRTGDLVRVDIRVSFGPHAAATCHEVIDHVPSGLVPVGNVAAWIDPDDESVLPDASLPYADGNQLVRWCAAPTSKDRTVELRYFARVITPGSYVWQPTVVVAAGATDRASVSPETRIEIR